MAGELGVELARLEGSGPGGRIVKADVESAAQDGGGAEEEAPAEAEEPEKEPAAKKESSGAKGEVEVQELTRLQQTVTRRMAESKATAPVCDPRGVLLPTVPAHNHAAGYRPDGAAHVSLSNAPEGRKADLRHCAVDRSRMGKAVIVHPGQRPGQAVV